jgi:threonyl-tRNA synthetase
MPNRPFWLSPRQVVVIPVAAVYKDYAAKVAKTFWDNHIFAEADLSDNTLGKKVRNAQVAQWNFIMSELGQGNAALSCIESLDV